MLFPKPEKNKPENLTRSMVFDSKQILETNPKPNRYEVISYVFRTIRKEKELPQYCICEALHVRVARAWYIDNGVGTITIEQFCKLAEYYNVNPYQVMALVDHILSLSKQED